MKFINKILFILLVFLSPFFGAAQELTNSQKQDLQIYPGYIVTSKHNDTIYGEIQFLNPVFNETVAIFYKQNGEKTIYHPSEGIISEYAFQYRQYNKETNTIEPLWFVYVRKLISKPNSTIGSIEAFVERQVYGEIILYNYYTLKTSRINSREYLHNYFVEKQGIEGFELKSITRDNYRDVIREYLVLGNDELEENLGTYGFGYKYLATLVEIQNAWLTGNPQYAVLLNLNSKK
jgi:hypothetical protein